MHNRSQSTKRLTNFVTTTKYSKLIEATAITPGTFGLEATPEVGTEALRKLFGSSHVAARKPTDPGV